MNSEDRAILEQEDLGEMVSHGAACPKCGERRMDSLVWDAGGELVTCATCGLTYTPNGKPTIQVLPAETHEVAKEG